MKNPAFINTLHTAKTAVILGLGTTGLASARFFLSQQKTVIIIEKQSREQFMLKASNAKMVRDLEKAGAQLSFMDLIPDGILKLDPKQVLVVISPGIPLGTKVAKTFKEKQFAIIGELELGLGLTDIPQIMVTGSNGKSTCVSLIDAMFQAAGSEPFLCGNIGNPVLNLLDESARTTPPDLLVVEASSYQLEAATTIRPEVAVLLNLSENHLERHGTMEKYLQAKARIATQQTQSEVAILNADDPLISSLASSLGSTLAYFGKQVPQTHAATALIEYEPLHGIDRITLRHTLWGTHVFECAQTKLVGEHARYNIAAASLAVLLLPGDVSSRVEAIRKVIAAFTGLDHRLQPVPTQSGTVAINDSKSTTVASAVAALRSVVKAYPHRPIRLMVGGKVKLGSWKPLADEILSYGDVVHVICFGGDGLFIQQELQQFGVQAYLAKNVAIATTYACDWIRQQEVLLFSPGCASFDEFSNFEERGRFFASVVGLR
jgi:UDP-N-acetylmuramoylalanine--D-glutamate ligase